MVWGEKKMKELRKEDVEVLDSGISGPRVIIMGGVHGNEKCGVEAIEDFLSNPYSLIKGKVTFIKANRKALDENVRFVEDNLNRCFTLEDLGNESYEKRLAKDIKSYLDESDFLLDLHASTSEDSFPFVICESNALAYAKNLDAEVICLGIEDAQPGGTEYYMNKIGGVGMCVECGYLGSNSSTLVAKKNIVNFLTTLGMINSSLENISSDKTVVRVMYTYSTSGEFKRFREFRDFEPIRKGDIIGYEDNEELLSDRDGFILFARDVERNSKDRECFLFGEFINN